MILENVQQLLAKLWEHFSILMDALLQHIRTLPQQAQNMPKEFDVLLVQFIKITIALALFLGFCFMFWFILSKIIELLKKTLWIVLAVMAVLLLLFWIRGLP